MGSQFSLIRPGKIRFKTLNPLDRQHDLRTFVRCSGEQKACAGFHHKTCWDASGKCQYCGGGQATTVEIAEPFPLQVVRKARALPIKPSAVYRKEELLVFAGLVLTLVTAALLGGLVYHINHPENKIPHEPLYSNEASPPESSSGTIAMPASTPARPLAPPPAPAVNSFPTPPQSAHTVRISYQCEATPYVEHMINSSSDNKSQCCSKRSAPYEWMSLIY